MSGSTETDGKMVLVTGVEIFVKFKKEAFAGASMPCRGFKVNGETPTLRHIVPESRNAEAWP